jgi:hypothetical protein
MGAPISPGVSSALPASPARRIDNDHIRIAGALVQFLNTWPTLPAKYAALPIPFSSAFSSCDRLLRDVDAPHRQASPSSSPIVPIPQ